VTANKEQLKALEQLQELDSQIDQIKMKQKQLPVQLKESKKLFVEAKSQLDKKTEEFTETEKKYKQIVAALELNQDRKDRANKRTEGVSDNQQFQAVNKELDQLKKLEEGLNKQKEELQAAFDEGKSEIDALETKISEAQGKYDELHKELSGENQTLVGQISEVESKKEPFLSSVSAPFLSRYKRLRVKGISTALVPAIAGKCKGCHLMLPPQVFNQLHHAADVVSCPNCHRILYIPEQEQVEEEKAVASGE